MKRNKKLISEVISICCICLILFILQYSITRFVKKKTNLNKYEHYLSLNNQQALFFLNKAKFYGLNEHLYYHNLFLYYEHFEKYEELERLLDSLLIQIQKEKLSSNRVIGEVYCYKGFIEYLKQNRTKARELYKKSLLHYPKNPKTLLQKAFLEYYEKNFAQALVNIEESIDLSESNNEHFNASYMLRGALRIINNNDTLAVKDFEKEIKLSHNNSMPITALIYYYLEKKNIVKANEYIVKLIQFRPEYSVGYLLDAQYAKLIDDESRYYEAGAWVAEKHKEGDNYLELDFVANYAPKTLNSTAISLEFFLNSSGIEFEWEQKSNYYK